MALENTPLRKPTSRLLKNVEIPPSPFMQKLGYGTGVQVYKMERSPLSDKVRSPWAIKKVIKSMPKRTKLFRDRLREEAEILAKLDHPNIIGFRAYILSNSSGPCLAMETCTKSLGDLIEQRAEAELQAFPATNCMQVAFDMSKALNYLHNTTLILHCDVKSYNVLVKDEFAICKLCDFGTSLPLSPAGLLDVAKVGEDVEFVGTNLWMAPEVVRYPQTITAKADIYSFGLVLWEMLALVPPNLSEANDGSDEEDVENCDPSEDRTRPDLPPQNFDSSYFPILELFYCCTEIEMELRPTAADLERSITEMTNV